MEQERIPLDGRARLLRRAARRLLSADRGRTAPLGAANRQRSRAADGHNVPRDDLARRPASLRAASVAAASPSALVLAGCGGDDAKSEADGRARRLDLPTGQRRRCPSGVTLTKAGTELKFGETATVAYEPNAKRSSVLSSSRSTRVAEGPDQRPRRLPARRRRARSRTPYYVRVRGEERRHRRPRPRRHPALRRRQHQRAGAGRRASTPPFGQVPVDAAARRASRAGKTREHLPGLPGARPAARWSRSATARCQQFDADHLEGHHQPPARQGAEEAGQEEEGQT